MDDLSVQITVLLIGQLITIISLFVTNYITRRQQSLLLNDEIQTRKQIEHLEQQLTKFYGPIAALLSMNRAILQLSPYMTKDSLADEVPEELWHDLRDNIMIPNNRAIVDIVKQSFHLIEGRSVPPHVFDFLVHAEVFSIRKKHGFSKENYLARFKFPVEFERHIDATVVQLKSEYLRLAKKDSSSNE